MEFRCRGYLFGIDKCFVRFVEAVKTSSAASLRPFLLLNHKTIFYQPLTILHTFFAAIEPRRTLSGTGFLRYQNHGLDPVELPWYNALSFRTRMTEEATLMSIQMPEYTIKIKVSISLRVGSRRKGLGGWNVENRFFRGNGVGFCKAYLNFLNFTPAYVF